MLSTFRCCTENKQYSEASKDKIQTTQNDVLRVTVNSVAVLEIWKHGSIIQLHKICTLSTEPGM